MPISVDALPRMARKAPPCIWNEQPSFTSTFSCGRATSGVRPAEPVVRLFLLPAVLNGLAKNAVFVAQPVAHRGELHRGHRVEEAGCQTPKSSIAQARVGLLF